MGGTSHVLRHDDRPDEILTTGGAWEGSEVDPVNLLLGLRDDDAYIAWAAGEWRAPTGFVTAEHFKGYVADAESITPAAREAGETGHIPYAKLASLLEQITYARPGPRGNDDLTAGIFDAPDFRALAAWSLVRAAGSGRYRFVDCPICKRPWFQDARAVRGECYRPAPESDSLCSQVAARERFERRHAAWMKEYRRIYARRQRGTVTRADWDEWIDFVRTLRATSRDNSRFTPFDEWKAMRTEND